MALEQHKPLFVLIHKSWCGACKSLKEHFKDGVSGVDEIKRLSRSFVMANVEDDEEPQDEQYKVDGDYIPRIFFASEVGAVDPELFNTLGSEQYKYFYGDGKSVLEGMRRALGKFSNADTTPKESSSSSSVADQLKEIASMYESGILSEEQFQAAKNKVLGLHDEL